MYRHILCTRRFLVNSSVKHTRIRCAPLFSVPKNLRQRMLWVHIPVVPTKREIGTSLPNYGKRILLTTNNKYYSTGNLDDKSATDKPKDKGTKLGEKLMTGAFIATMF